MRCRTLAAVSLAVIAGAAAPAAAQPPAAPLLHVLRDTGRLRDGVPVLEPHPDEARYVALLSRGLSGRLLRLYALEQRYLQRRNGTVPQPAYLLISNNQGGFPRFGFYLGSEDKRGVGYVDLAESARPVGYFGAMDQIFPHELAHVIVTQIAGPPQPGGASQMHAIGVRTDANMAFQEGFAEHLQVLAFDDPDALPETRELLARDFFLHRAERQLREYSTELQGRWPIPGRRRAAFPLWFSSSEQALRYYAVKANLFARQPRIAERLLRPDPWPAYLLENVLPGLPADPPKRPAQLASTEGVIASLFVAWVSDPAIREARREPAFYEAFGTTAEAVGPLENAYLKMVHAWFVSRPHDLASAVAGYKASFPDEAGAVDRVVRKAFLGGTLEPGHPIWLLNRHFRIGTSLFDQYRSQPRAHAFDLNAASVVDLVAVPGIDAALAREIVRRTPYDEVEGVRRVPGMTPALVGEFQRMEREAAAARENIADEESHLTVAGILRPYAWRALALVVVAGLLGAAAYRRVMPLGWPRAIVNGLAAAFLGFLLEVALELPRGVLALVGPVALCGLPAALFCLLFPGRSRRRVERRQAAGGAGRPAAAVSGAALPAARVTTSAPVSLPPGRARLALRVAVAWLLASAPLAILMTPWL